MPFQERTITGLKQMRKHMKWIAVTSVAFVSACAIGASFHQSAVNGTVSNDEFTTLYEMPKGLLIG